MLTKFKPRIRYNTGEHNLVKEFYIPCLESSVEYRRAVGYFTSGGLAVAAQGIASLFKNDGKMQLVASPNLTVEDIEAINSGLNTEDVIFKNIIEREIHSIEDYISRKRLEALSWMIREGLLEVRIAFKGKPKITAGLFHEKGGIFKDKEGNRIAFSGSGNETRGGWDDNYETLNTYRSWNETAPYVREIENDFNRLWENTYPNLTILDFTEAARDALRPYYPQIRPKLDPEEFEERPERGINDENEESRLKQVCLPKNIKLRDYQKQAIRGWFSVGGRGTFKMATGAGKTITALALAVNLFQRKKSKCFVVIAPYIHLVRQWTREAREFGFSPLAIYGSHNNWSRQLDERLTGLKGSDLPVFIVTTNDGFRGINFQSQVENLPNSALLIADEVHNLGTEKLRQALPDHVQYRLGLSATPERHFDDEGTSKILNYFGEILAPEYTLKQALENNVLCPYEYNLIRVDFTDDEDQIFQDLSLKIARACSGKKEEKQSRDEICKSLLIKRARLVANAANKLQALEYAIEPYKNDGQILVYCGSGQSNDLEDNVTRRQIDHVCQVLGNKLDMRVSTFTHETELERRDDLLEELGSGDIQGLVAIRCLDEGVDVPSIKTAFILASSTNPRQYVQRRGRLLRRHPGKKLAKIYDFIVLPNKPVGPDKVIGSLVKKELIRAYEFAKLARNKGEATQLILKWGLEYGVNVFGVENSRSSNGTEK